MRGVLGLLGLLGLLGVLGLKGVLGLAGVRGLLEASDVLPEVWGLLNSEVWALLKVWPRTGLSGPACGHWSDLVSIGCGHPLGMTTSSCN